MPVPTLLGVASGSGGIFNGGAATAMSKAALSNFSTVATSGRGSWTELSTTTGTYVNGTGTTKDMDAFSIQLGANGNSTGSRIVDVGIGASGSQTVIAADLVHHVAADFIHSTYLIHRAIPAGTKVWLRQYNNLASSATWGGITPLVGPPSKGQQYEILHFNLGTDAAPGSLGTSILQSNLVTWVQLVASSAVNITAIRIMIIGRTGTSAWGGLAIGVGAAGFEVRAGGVQFGGPQTSVVPQCDPLWIPVDIPAGSRVAATSYASSGGTDAWRIVVYGLKAL